MKTFILFPAIILIFAVSAASQQRDQESAAAPRPVSYGLVVDNSGSYRLLLDRIIDLVKEVVGSNAADDETFLVTFVDSDKVRLHQDLTKNKDLLNEAAEEMYIEGGQTAILDAISFSAKHLVEKTSGAPERARVLVLISDGDERASAVKIEDVIKYLRDEKIRLFAIGISDEKVTMKILDRLTKETGGKKYLPKSRAETPDLVKSLSADIRAK
jgi:Ca-activated chloride channel family protein